MRFKLLFILAILLSLNSFTAEAQNQSKQSLTLVKYKENVKAPLTVKELNMLKEAYTDQLEKYVLSNPQRLKDMKHLLRNRIKIKAMPELTGYSEKYITLSQAGLFDSYNKNLILDTSYNPNTFNPLKYNLQFFGRGQHLYRIDNTDYFILIKSQQQ